MKSPDDLPVGVQQEIESSFVRDRFKGLSGPCPVGPFFLEELHRIDPRLVLRWQPFWNLYAVWVMMADGRLWSQPVHRVHNGTNNFRRPDIRDIRMIRRANWYARHQGYDAWVKNMDKVAYMGDMAAGERRDEMVKEYCRQISKQYDLKVADFGVTRGAIFSGGGLER